MNELYYGDNLDVLRKYVKNESVDLCYIDPPFNSKRNYNQIYNNVGKEDVAQAQAFVDTWVWDDLAIKGFEEIVENQRGIFTSQTINLILGLEKVLSQGSLLAYLVSMTLRVAEVHRVLKSTGSFYFHCDPTSSHYLKLIIDSVFCPQGGDFKNEIIWRRTGSHGKSKRYSPIHDVIFFYTKSDKYRWNSPVRPYMKGHVEKAFKKDGDLYKTNYSGNILSGSGIRNGESGKPWMGFNPTAKNRHWAIPSKLLDGIEEQFEGLTQHEKLDKLYEMGIIKIKPDCEWPVYERYVSESDGQSISDLWTFQPYTENTVFSTTDGIDADVRWLGSKDSERQGYETQKPEGLLERILTASTDEGDVVLDAYCGCGTTVAVAQKLNRKWIGIDITYQSISLILKRLEDSYGEAAVFNVKMTGIPRDMKSAEALANKNDDRTRKEFEKWAILTFSNNRAVINPKKGADKGIDGTAFFIESEGGHGRIIFQVKSGKVDSRDIRDLLGTMTCEKAALGIFITLKKPTKDMLQEAKTCGLYHHNIMGCSYDKIAIVTVQDMIENGLRLHVPLSIEVLKSAQRKNQEDNQLSIALNQMDEAV